jgi:hypothetical protein
MAPSFKNRGIMIGAYIPSITQMMCPIGYYVLKFFHILVFSPTGLVRFQADTHLLTASPNENNIKVLAFCEYRRFTHSAPRFNLLLLSHLSTIDCKIFSELGMI